MKQHSFFSHTPGEKRRLSNLGHTVHGLLLGIVGALALFAYYSTAAWVALT